MDTNKCTLETTKINNNSQGMIRKRKNAILQPTDRLAGALRACSSSDSAPVQCGPANHKTATWSNGIERENLLRQAPSAGSNGLETLAGDVEYEIVDMFIS